MADGNAPRNYSPHQQKIIRRYYDNIDGIALTRLAELVGDLYLAEGKKKQGLWKRAEAALQNLKVPATRVEHLMKQQNPALLADLVKELQKK